MEWTSLHRSSVLSWARRSHLPLRDIIAELHGRLYSNQSTLTVLRVQLALLSAEVDDLTSGPRSSRRRTSKYLSDLQITAEECWYVSLDRLKQSEQDAPIDFDRSRLEASPSGDALREYRSAWAKVDAILKDVCCTPWLSQLRVKS